MLKFCIKRTRTFPLSIRWQSLHAVKGKKEDDLSLTKTLYDFHQMCDETQAWINEKDQLLSTDDIGRDLPAVQKLQRRHQVSCPMTSISTAQFIIGP